MKRSFIFKFIVLLLIVFAALFVYSKATNTPISDIFDSIFSGVYDGSSDLISPTPDTNITLDENGEYTSREEVGLYIHLYGCLPDNYITKSQAISLGWNSNEGNLWIVAQGKSIGGDVFGNYEELLPDKDGRIWYECDINYSGGFRGSERIVYSNDGLIFYTPDHYESFIQLY